METTVPEVVAVHDLLYSSLNTALIPIIAVKTGVGVSCRV
jgi:hypothetical protein